MCDNVRIIKDGLLFRYTIISVSYTNVKHEYIKIFMVILQSKIVWNLFLLFFFSGSSEDFSSLHSKQTDDGQTNTVVSVMMLVNIYLFYF